ncbi:rab11 family-interacting protein 2-like [Gigantopelta aegis]|uniref:rab11 family-interacting protein 2-like n=1 Tax=Gigantopelta aegis TaxID=1735272 RepID=UPI001B88E308|nr:rab11 family-interacting protein 2-like [Gigantopelta aegis]
MWSPSHVQFTVLRARNLIPKGKGGNNDVFVQIQLGKEKYQTSTIKNAHNPEWFEECDLPIPHMHSEIEVTLYHRGVLSDDFLGYVSVALWDYKVGERPQSQWIPLRHKPSKGPDNKYRGELEIKLTFHVEKSDSIPGLKKRSSSIRSIATAVGEKLKINKNRSFRENRKDPEGSKSDRRQPRLAGDAGFGHDREDGPLSRSYSMSAAYIKSMSLDRGRIAEYESTPIRDDPRSRSLCNINVPGSRRSCVEFSNYTIGPPPYEPHQSSQDDSALSLRDHSINRQPLSRATLGSNSSYIESMRRRERSLYESIKERTEESSSSDNESTSRPHSRPVRMVKKDSNKDFDADVESIAESPIKVADENLENGVSGETTVDKTSENAVPVGSSSAKSDKAEMMVNGDARKEDSKGASSLRKKIIPNAGDSFNSGLSYKENGHQNGHQEVPMRKKAKRERLRQLYIQGGRRYTVQGFESREFGLYDDSMSDLSDPAKMDFRGYEDMIRSYRNLTKDELVRLVVQNKAQMIRKDRYIQDLENYIDNLLVRVMENQPRLLHRFNRR